MRGGILEERKKEKEKERKREKIHLNHVKQSHRWDLVPLHHGEECVRWLGEDVGIVEFVELKFVELEFGLALDGGKQKKKRRKVGKSFCGRWSLILYVWMVMEEDLLSALLHLLREKFRLVLFPEEGEEEEQEEEQEGRIRKKKKKIE